MEKTWIAKFLPKDEYREKKVLYFFTEAAIIMGVLLFVYSILATYVSAVDIPGFAIAFMSWMFLIIYVSLRYTLTGIEHPDVATKKRYKKKKRATFFSSLTFFVIFLVGSLVVKGIPTDMEQTADLFIPTVLAAILFYTINYIALKKSYKKNKELLDD